jgi:hypothetical protein
MKDTKEEDFQRVDGGIFAGVVGSPVTSEDWTEDSDTTGDVEAIQDKSTICPSSLDIMSWYQKADNSEPEPPPSLIPTPFERGIIGSMSVNDVLMVKGLINTLVYIQFIDLSSFGATGRT